MVVLLECPRFPLNIYHWTLHGKLWPLAFTQTPSHSTSGSLIQQTTHCCLHSDPLSLHIKTHELKTSTTFLKMFFFSFTLSLTLPLLLHQPQQTFPFLSICTSFRALANYHLSPSLLSFSFYCVMKRIWVATVAMGVEGAGKGREGNRVRMKKESRTVDVEG